MRIIVALSILVGLVVLLAALMPAPPERPLLPTVSPLRVTSGFL